MRREIMLFASLALGTAQAGTVLESTTTDVRSGKPVDTTIVSAQGNNLRLERRSAIDPADRSLVIFAGDKLYVIDDRTKAYRVMDRTALQTIEAARAAEAERIGAADAKKSAQQAAKKTVARPQSKLVDTGRSDKVGDWSCRTWNETVQGRVLAEHCVVPLAKLEGGDDLAAALKSFSTFWRTVASDYPGLQDTGGRLALAYEKMKGVPVRTKTFVAGKPHEVATITAVRADQLGAAMFQVPQGYEQQNMVREAQASR
jgi:hypothetical protein